MVDLKKGALIGSAALALALASAPLRAQDGKAPTDKTEAEWNAQKVEAKRSQIDATAGAALDQLLKGNTSAKELYEKAYGWAAFDNLKLGFFFSGGGGKGVAVAKKSGKRTYMDMGSAGFGLAFGGKKYEVVFLFQATALVYFTLPVIGDQRDLMNMAEVLFQKDYNIFLHFGVAAGYFLGISLVIFVLFGLIYRRLMRHLPGAVPLRFNMRRVFS